MQRTLERELKVPETAAGEAVGWVDRRRSSPGRGRSEISRTGPSVRPVVVAPRYFGVIFGVDQRGLIKGQKGHRGKQVRLPHPGP
jgi:hypothetical protein